MTALKLPDAPPSDGARESSGGGAPTTAFSFQNKLFSVEGGYFSMTRDSKEPVFHVMLGELKAALPLPTLREEFGIAVDSPDGKLLGIVERSLRFVKEICPND